MVGLKTEINNKKSGIQRKILRNLHLTTNLLLILVFVFYAIIYHFQLNQHYQQRLIALKDEGNMLKLAFVFSLVSIWITNILSRRRVRYLTSPIQEIVEGIQLFNQGNREHRLEIKTGDEFEEIADALNKTADLLVADESRLKEELKKTTEDKEKIYKVYHDVIFAITQGKFNLLRIDERVRLAAEGALYSEIELLQPEDIDKARRTAEQYLRMQNCSEHLIGQVMLCVSEAATNVIKHAEEGQMQIRKLDGQLRVTISDRGPGIDYEKLPYMVFLSGFSTKISMGFGFSLMYKYADKLYLFTSDNGIFLGLDFKLN